MGTEFMRLIILGKIPGTNIQLTYFQIGATLITLMVLAICMRLLLTARKKLTTIDPFYRAPRGMTIIDLTAL